MATDKETTREAFGKLANILASYHGVDARKGERDKRIQDEIRALRSADLPVDQLITECATFKIDLLMTIERAADIMKLGRLGVDVSDSLIKNHTKGLTLEGRVRGGDTMKERAAKRKNHMRAAVEDILRHRNTFDWDEGRIANYLMKEGFHEYEGVKPIGKKQMMRDIKKIKADFKASSR